MQDFLGRTFFIHLTYSQFHVTLNANFSRLIWCEMKVETSAEENMLELSLGLLSDCNLPIFSKSWLLQRGRDSNQVQIVLSKGAYVTSSWDKGNKAFNINSNSDNFDMIEVKSTDRNTLCCDFDCLLDCFMSCWNLKKMWDGHHHIGHRQVKYDQNDSKKTQRAYLMLPRSRVKGVTSTSNVKSIS